MKNVLLGVTSGIAAFKVLELIKLLKEDTIDVTVMMTNKARHMIPQQEIEFATGNKVYTELFEKDFDYKKILERRIVDHIELADKADVIAIMPATANTIAKIAHGIADDFLTTTLLASTAPIIICPAMNVHMWSNPAVKKNVATLKDYGFQIIEPTKGMLACGYEGIGRLEDIDTIKQAIIEQLEKNNFLAGKKILVTAGGTIEKIDDVRFITNKSSGKMGIAIAEECFKRGADVILLKAHSAINPRFQMKEELFETADELMKLVHKHIVNADVMFHVAAVSDFQITDSVEGKMDSSTNHTLQLTSRKKILDVIKLIHPKITLIAFKAESYLSEKKLIAKAQKRLKESKADFIIANDVAKTDCGFQVDTNEVVIIDKNGMVKKIPFALKKEIAEQIVHYTLLS